MKWAKRIRRLAFAACLGVLLFLPEPYGNSTPVRNVPVSFVLPFIPPQSETHEEVVQRLAAEYAVPYDLVQAIWAQECSGKSQCEDSKKGARGPFQVMPRTAQEHLKCPINWDEDFLENAKCGIRYLAEGYQKCGGLYRATAHRYYTGLCSQKGVPWGDPSGAEYINDIMHRVMKWHMRIHERNSWPSAF